MVGEMLRRHRRQAGLTQTTLASRAGVSVRALREIERDRVRHPRPRSLDLLADALGLADADHDRLLAAAGADPAGRRDGPLRIGVLGALVARRGDTSVETGRGRQRSLLALLALQPGRVVARDEIVDTLWGERPPRTCAGLGTPTSRACAPRSRFSSFATSSQCCAGRSPAPDRPGPTGRCKAALSRRAARPGRLVRAVHRGTRLHSRHRRIPRRAGDPSPPAVLASAVGLGVAGSLILVTSRTIVVVTIALVALALLPVTTNTFLTRLLHDELPSTIRARRRLSRRTLSWRSCPWRSVWDSSATTTARPPRDGLWSHRRRGWRPAQPVAVGTSERTRGTALDRSPEPVPATI